jgi:two-component system invasion response regulator UvrY
MNGSLTILIAEDHMLIREAWSFMLSSDPRFRVIADTNDGEEAVRLTRELEPDIVILDLSIKRMGSVEVAGLIREHSPNSKILAVSMHARPAHIRSIMQSGAMGCITKNSGSYEMFKAIMAIHEGREYICDEIKDALSELLITGNGDQSGVNTLSQREIEIISHIKNGESSKEIAANLHISKKTIEVHRYNIMKKLGLKNVAALVNYVNNYQLELDERLTM